MSSLQSVSATVPSAVRPERAVRQPGVAGELVRLEGRLAAMGLLERLAGELDAAAQAAWEDPSGRAVYLLQTVASVGIGGTTVAALLAEDDPDAWRSGLADLRERVEQSPFPHGEWMGLGEVLGGDLLQSLLGIGRSSLARYRAGQRQTPDPVAARLHHLALVVAELEGGYNAYGIRRWFARPRPQLEGKSPAELLERDWDPEDAGPQRVLALAVALNASPAT